LCHQQACASPPRQPGAGGAGTTIPATLRRRTRQGTDGGIRSRARRPPEVVSASSEAPRAAAAVELAASARSPSNSARAATLEAARAFTCTSCPTPAAMSAPTAPCPTICRRRRLHRRRQRRRRLSSRQCCRARPHHHFLLIPRLLHVRRACQCRPRHRRWPRRPSTMSPTLEVT